MELIGTNKVKSSPLACLVLWYQQTDPHRRQRDSLHFMTVDAITFPAQPEVSGVQIIIKWLCDRVLRNVAVVSQTKGKGAVSCAVFRRAAKSSHSCALRMGAHL
jgi:hypothetical protein